jgi:hypothetical protein
MGLLHGISLSEGRKGLFITVQTLNMISRRFPWPVINTARAAYLGQQGLTDSIDLLEIAIQWGYLVGLSGGRRGRPSSRWGSGV